MRESGSGITDTNTINGFIDKANIFRMASVIFLSYVILLNLTGCADRELHRFVTEWKTDEIEEESLGEIMTEGEYCEVNPDNILSYKGTYKGPDYVTLVFDSSSPINLENVELCINEQKNYNFNLNGILYQEKDGNKYITFKYESTQSEIAFILPTKTGEPMSYYLICIKPIFYKDYEANVSEYIQREVVERSYYTDYRYDVLTQYYDRESDSWTEEKTKIL